MLNSLFEAIHSPWLYPTVITVYIVTMVGVVAVLVSENRNPVKTLAWITVLLLLPGLGLLIYLVFGRSIKNTRMISRHNRRRLRRKESFRRVKIDKLGLTSESKQQITLCRSLAASIYYPCNGVDVYVAGKDMFDNLLSDIDNAKYAVDLQFYIVSDDELGRRLQRALIAKAKQGVTVRMIYDSVGSYRTSNRYFRELKDAGVQAFPFFKVSFPPFGTRINWRNHRKLCVIDGRIGYIGGMNVASRYIDGGKEFNSWRDTHLRITGPAVGAIQYSFAVDWNFIGQPLVEEAVPKDRGEEHDCEGVGMQMLTAGPTTQWSNIAILFIKAIGNAKIRVFLQTPYFLPSDGMLKTLQAAALCGVDVRVMLPARSDSRLLDRASFSYIAQCLQSGVKVYLYKAGMLHAKMLVVDDEFVSIGSSNFDFRSFEHNFEANMQLYSRDVCRRMTEVFLHDAKFCERVDLNQWKRRSVWSKACESAARLLSPVL